MLRVSCRIFSSTQIMTDTGNGSGEMYTEWSCCKSIIFICNTTGLECLTCICTFFFCHNTPLVFVCDCYYVCEKYWFPPVCITLQIEKLKWINSCYFFHNCDLQRKLFSLVNSCLYIHYIDWLIDQMFDWLIFECLIDWFYWFYILIGFTDFIYTYWVIRSFVCFEMISIKYEIKHSYFLSVNSYVRAQEIYQEISEKDDANMVRFQSEQQNRTATRQTSNQNRKPTRIEILCLLTYDFSQY